jgi:L-aminopeptidase/D-esterase-like protein
MVNNTITRLKGVRVGNAEYRQMTGCTVVLFDKPYPVLAKTFGGWPGTFDTESSGYGKAFFRKRAIFISGGDVLGLACASGIMRYLLERGMASSKQPSNLPFVVGADIYDQDISDVSEVDFSELGYKACINSSTQPVKQGNYGAGVGATVGKLLGIEYASKGGIGSSFAKLGKIQVGTLVVVNSIGDVYNPYTGNIIAGARKKEGGYVEFNETIKHYLKDRAVKKSTTVLVVATNVRISHEYFERISVMAYAGLARCIFPIGLSHDGDTVFVFSNESFSPEEDELKVTDLVGILAARSAISSVINAVKGGVSED